MTDARKARRGSPGAMAVVVLTLGGFLILLSILSLQMRAGHDPTLGSTATATAEQPRVILKRRIVVTRIIITDAPTPAAGSPSSGAGVAGQVAASAPGPVRTAAPVQAAPVQAAPVAPPPPAPVTRTS